MQDRGDRTREVNSMKRKTVYAALWLLFGTRLLFAQDDEGLEVASVQRDTPVSFEEDIEPFLRRNCLACHNESETEGELILESVESVLRGGDSGPAVVPKDAEESLLFQLAAHRTEPIMPPVDNDVGAKPLGPKELGLLKLWIEQGAKAGGVKKRETIQWKMMPPGFAPVYALELSPDGRWLAAGRGNQLMVYSLPGKRLVQHLIDDSIGETHPDCAHLDVTQSVAWSPDQQTLVSGGFRCIKVWQRRPVEVSAGLPKASAEDTALIEGLGEVVSHVVLKDASRLVAVVKSDAGNTLRLFELPSKMQIGEWKPDLLFQDRLADVERQLGLAREYQRVAKADVETAKKRRAEEEKLVKKNEDELKKAKEAVPKAMDVLTKAEDDRKKKEEELAAVEKSVSDQQKAIKEVTDQIAATEDKQALVEQKNKLETDLENLRNQVAAKKKELENAATNAKKKRQEFEGKEKVVTLTQGAIDRGKKAIVLRQKELSAAEETATSADEAVKSREAAVEQKKKQIVESGIQFGEIAAANEWSFSVRSADSRLIGHFNAADGKLLAVDEAAVYQWQLVKTIGDDGDETPFADRVTSLAFSHDGKMLATGGGEPSRTGEVHVWDTESWSLVGSVEDVHSDVVYDLQFSPQNDALASCASDRMMKTIDPRSLALLRSFEGHTGHVMGVSWRADGRTLATAGADKVVKVWDAVEGTQKKTVSGFKSEVTGVRFVGLDDRFVFSTGDGKVESRNSSGQGKPGFAGFSTYVHRVSSSRDGKVVAAAGQDQVVRVWDNAGKLVVAFEE